MQATLSRAEQVVSRALTKAQITGPSDLVRRLADIGHHTDPSQAMRWLRRDITPRPPAMRALAKVLGVDAGVLATWFLEGAQ